tara:strand:- start:287 stop:457 length:171 start_codon:yes stop_codon:yes gene_type:complete
VVAAEEEMAAAQVLVVLELLLILLLPILVEHYLIYFPDVMQLLLELVEQLLQVQII